MSARVLVTGGYGLLGSWLVRALLERGERASCCCGATSRPARRSSSGGLEERCAVVRGDVTDAALIDRVARRIRGRHGLPPRRPDDRRHRAPLARRDVGDQRPRHVGAARGLPRAGGRGGRRRRLGQGLRPDRRRCPTREDHAARPDRALRRQQGRGRPDRPLLLRHTYGLPGGHDALRQPLRRWRLQPLAAHPRGGRRRAGRPRAGRSAPTARPSATSSTSRTPSPPTWRSATRSPTGDGAGEAFNAGSGQPARPCSRSCALVCRAAGSDVEPDIRGTGTPAGEIDRQCVDAGKLRAATGWAPEVSLEEGLRRTVDWYRALT